MQTAERLQADMDPARRSNGAVSDGHEESSITNARTASTTNARSSAGRVHTLEPGTRACRIPSCKAAPCMSSSWIRLGVAVTLGNTAA
jgi:hypothetical protein